MQAQALRQSNRPAKIMVLEDDALNAMLIQDTLQLAGHEVVGPARTIPYALSLLDYRDVDAAILDLQIDDKVSFEVGRKLDELGIPWAITTAHPRSFVLPRFSHVPLLAKPFSVVGLLELIKSLLDDRS